MAELVDAPDSKSGSGNRVWGRFPLPAPLEQRYPLLAALRSRVGLAASPLRLPRPRQDSRQRIVALVAGVFVQRLIDRIERHLAAPRLREYLRILDGELVKDRARAAAREALDHFEVLARRHIAIAAAATDRDVLLL